MNHGAIKFRSATAQLARRMRRHCRFRRTCRRAGHVRRRAPAVVDVTDGDIVVTARRREERLIDVPLSVTAFTGEALLQQGIQDLTQIGQQVPNITLEVSRGTNTTLTAFIRGVGQQDPVAGFEAGVGLYIDDVYLNRPQAAVLDIYDVERIEVLRGPQGTLYGRNTIGGAIKYVTAPLPDETRLKVRGTYGSLIRPI
jgi:iron complex outermembrane recepter protein